jgi:hypothetical protein
MTKLIARFRYQILIFLAVLGPGFITAMVDNDSGGIYVYSAAGARWGYLTLWTLIPITLLLVFTQEMCSRMGAVTGKGLSDLVREEFGLRLTFILMTLLVLMNFTNVVAEFAGVASSLEHFHISKYVSVPLAAVAVWFLVVKGNYRSVEKIFLFACVLYGSYIVSGILVKPDWKEAAIDSFKPVLMLNHDYIYMLIAMLGTTIAPWMQFYLQSAIVEKGITVKEYVASRVEVVVLHHRGLRGRHIQHGSQGHSGCRPGGVGTQAVRAVRLPAVQRGPVQRLDFLGFDPAALDRLFGLRRVGIRNRPRQGLARSADVLYALHGVDRGRRRGGAVATLPAGEDDSVLAGAQRRAAAVRSDPDDPAD